MINFNRWGPTQAQGPVTAALLAYELLSASIWLRGLWCVIHGPPAAPRPWQFPLRSLLLIMFGAAISLGAFRLVLNQSRDVLLAVAIGLFVAVMYLLAWLLVQTAFVWATRPTRAIGV